MTKHFVGIVGALLGALAGAWLMVAPFALAYQPEGADWADPTFVDFWTGLGLLIVSVVGLISYASGLVEELRRRGILQRRVYEEPAAPAARSQQEAALEQTLTRLLAAMLKDQQEQAARGHAPQESTHQETVSPAQEQQPWQESSSRTGGQRQ